MFTHAGTHELDAAVMDGATLRAGAVACVSRVRHPLRAARAVMERSEHVLLVGAGAEAFAQACGLELVSPDYFSTKLRREQLQSALSAGTALLDHDAPALSFIGGMTNKRVGHVGDSPLIGAGTGEMFIRAVTAYDICARMAMRASRWTQRRRNWS